MYALCILASKKLLISILRLIRSIFPAWNACCLLYKLCALKRIHFLANGGCERARGSHTRKQQQQ